jgi:Haem-NO-binding
MYGLVNKAVTDFIVANFGQEMWEKLAARAEADETFLSMEQYPDEVTYKLVATISEELKLEPSQVLETFGEYWVTFTAQNGYGPLMKMSGKTVREFLQNLNGMHERVKANMTDLKPPSFEVENVGEKEILLHYRSERAGLSPMVVGLLRGLGKMFNETLNVNLVEVRSEVPAHFVYRVINA